MTRPTVARDLVRADEINGIAMLPPGRPLRGNELESYLRSEERACVPETNECLEGRLLLALQGKPRRKQPGFEEVVARVWQEHTQRAPLPVRSGSRPPVTSGMAILYRQGSAEHCALAYRSGEVANDRYLYTESICRLADRERCVPVRLERFYYEVAGLEVLNWSGLWLINVLALVVLAPLIAVIGRIARRSRGSRPDA